MRFHTIITLSFLLLLLPAAAKEPDSDESLRAFMIECRTAIQPGDPADFLMSRYRPRKDLWAQWMIFQDAFHVSPAEKEAARREIRQVCGELRRGRAWPYRERPRLRIPFLTTPPEIDGKIGGEWQKAVRLSATYERDNPVPVAGKAARWFFGWDRETFYAAGEFQAGIPAKIPESEIKPTWESGEIVLSRVVIPEYVVVHDGAPTDSTARDYYVRYRDYIKNVACSEIYATWPDAAIRANILAIMSFTLNRVYTEWYRNKGYDFTITSSTAYDHKWIYGRNIFDSISLVVDEIFADYLSRPNVKQPILTQYCDGNRVSCPNWMSQWGS